MSSDEQVAAFISGEADRLFAENKQNARVLVQCWASRYPGGIGDGSQQWHVIIAEQSFYAKTLHEIRSLIDEYSKTPNLLAEAEKLEARARELRTKAGTEQQQTLPTS